MTIQGDELLRAYLLEEARRVTTAAPSLDEAVAGLAPRLDRRSSGGSRGLLVLIAAALLLTTLAATIAIGSGVLRLPPTVDLAPPGTLPVEQTAVILRQVAALDSRDPEAFAEVFADYGAFDPRGTFASSSSLLSNTLPIADRSLLELFMAINETWRYGADVVRCDWLSRSEYERSYGGPHHDSSDTFGHCAVVSRWPALSLEIGEWWAYEFNGPEILWWTQRVRDATPTGRTLPLGLDGLLDWESWLKATDPGAAARLLNPRVYIVVDPQTGDCDPCEWTSDDVDVDRIIASQPGGRGRGENDWVIAGRRFWPSMLVPYDPALADEIEASIEDFLGR